MSGNVTKKYRCRVRLNFLQYFFVHPTDSNWPGLRPFVDTRLLNRSASKKNKANSGKAGGSAHYSVPSPEGRGPALVSQSDLFQRCKVEVDDQATLAKRNGTPRTDRDRDYQRERDGGNHTGTLDSGNKNRFHGGYTKNRSISPARTYAKKYNKTGSDSSKKLTELDNKSKGATGKRSEDAPSNEIKRMAAVPNAALKTSVDSKDDFSSSSLQNAKPWLISSFVPTIPNKDDAPTPTLAVVSDERRRAERLVGLFRGLAKLSNQVVQDTAAQEREGQKLQTYTEISSALSKISASAATVEENFKALGGVWEQVFDVFVTEITHVIDAGLQDAIATIKKEGEHAVKEIVANAAGSLKLSMNDDPFGSHDKKRSRTRGVAEKENEETRSGRAASRDRDHKRRRLASHSSSPDSRDRRRPQSGDSSIDDILTRMKMKLDQQAQSLQMLSKENSELKTTLKQQTLVPSTSSCSSFSVSSTPNQPKASGSRSTHTTPTKPRVSTERLDYFRT
ncbi:hypothetical protein C8J57DRAFT_1286012 [Mycena rebaudengoi]|nr:hypothetical protein C8J57DRAFT_1286012 [Mycena rebaudengoi]